MIRTAREQDYRVRAINWTLGAILLAFAALQLNDPDALYWAALYAIGGAWCLAAAWRPRRVAERPWPALLAITLALVLGALVWLWPVADGWWRMSVWWEDETAREGLGLIILGLSLLAAWSTVRRSR